MKKYLALGDSYTCGTAILPEECFPRQLATLLMTDEPNIIAERGWTAQELAIAMEVADVYPPYDLVTLLIGVNDQTDVEAKGTSPETYKSIFAYVLQTAIWLAGGDPRRVFVLSIPDWSVTPFAKSLDKVNVSVDIKHYNSICKIETNAAGACFVDVDDLVGLAAGDSTLVAADSLHFSAKMYELWAERLAQKVSDEAILQVG